MTLLLTIMCLTFIIFTIAEVVLVIKLFNVNEIKIKENTRQLRNIEKEQKEDLKQIFHQISGLINSYGKTINLIQKAKSAFAKDIAGISHDLDNLYEWNKQQNKSIVDLMQMHNQLTDITYDSLKEIFCDLNNCECSECEFYNECAKHPSQGLDNADNTDLNKKNIHVENNSEAWDSAIASLDNRVTFKMDLSNPEQFNELRSKMKSSGIPDRVIDNYIEQIKYLVKVGIAKEDQSIEVVWGTKNRQGYLATSVTGENFGMPLNNEVIRNSSKKQKFNKEIEKLVDPNLKIIQSLERLYKSSDNKE